MLGLLWCLSLALLFSPCLSQGTEDDARTWLVEYNAEAQLYWFEAVDAAWNYDTNLTEYNLNISLNRSAEAAQFDMRSYERAILWDYANFVDDMTRREFENICNVGTAVLPADDYNAMNTIQAEMNTIYSTAEVCNRPGYPAFMCFPMDPDLTHIMGNSTDYDELTWAWEGWREQTGRLMPDLYQEFVGYQDQAAKANDYKDTGDYWRSWYDIDRLLYNFEDDCERLWQEVKPFYEQVHAYTRKKLQEFYVGHPFPADGHIPAHLLGNMWAQSWSNLEWLLKPYPNKPSVDVTDELVRQGYDANGLFVLSEDFFTSLGLLPMPQPFWDESMIERPTDGRDVVCHASAWDFMNQVDFRIKQCTEVTHDWLLTTHHEMGHVEYFLQYAPHPVQFRDGANPGFHEAIGDVLSLSVNTPEHLYKLGLLPDYVNDTELDMNFLMSQSLEKIAFLPFGYMIDQWRWSVFAGSTPKIQYNSDWWKARCHYQGISPPVERSRTQDFDAGSKFHIPNNTPYIRYFVAHILQFQFHKALCDAAGHVGPLHKCDIYESPAAGQLLEALMQLGSSQSWDEALFQLTGSYDMSALPLVEYFQPLIDWLENENIGEPIGWDTSKCPDGSLGP